MELSRCSYVILGILRSQNATDKIHGMTVIEISEKEKISKPNTIHKKIKEMELEGYVASGAKAGKAKSYYLTESGSKLLPIKKNVEVQEDV